MQAQTIQQLLTINKEFYQTFASSFSQTRQRIQHGILLILNDLPKSGNWLDLGCGNGALALEWDRQRRQGCYLGLDFSSGMLDCARKTVTTMRMSSNLQIDFVQTDLTDAKWLTRLPEIKWDGIMAFAVLHHIPGNSLRTQMIKQIYNILGESGIFIFSVWQFQNSPKLMERRIGWEQVGLSNSDVELGDTLLDWRADVKDNQSAVGLRYVHLFTKQEMAELAASTGFQVVDLFDSDGFNGKLGHYQVWKKL
jgi:ubiquinone/menaquinone biosynthesis C-methylase UbiE